jgi:hypothetical protein
MSDIYKCKICDKIYSSMSSRSNHIKRIHNTPVSQNGKESKDLCKCDIYE